MDGAAKTAKKGKWPSFPRLIAVWPEGSLTRDLPKDRALVVGRSAGVDVCVDHPSVSRRHFKVHSSPALAVEDLGSFNGTSLGGKELTPNVTEPWPPGAVLEAGMATCFLQGATESKKTRRVQDSGQTAGKTSADMNAVSRIVDIVAPARISVILYGETGVGKELMAQRIHASSPRAGLPLLCLNCAALPDTLLESELFGFERGAFTGAVQAKPGLFESAEGGSILLDEVGDMPLGTQVKLLRVLESREVQRLGASRGRPFDVRILAATHRDLRERVAANAFRADLFYRLDGVTIRIPPLRERVGEIVPLAESFVAIACKELGKPIFALTRATKDALERYAWPGNIRELKNVVSRAALFAGSGPLDLPHFESAPWTARAARSDSPVVPATRDEPSDLRTAVNDLERRRILSALEETGGNQTRAAKVLGISRRTLVDRLDTYGLPRPQKRSKP
jgi:transcriptional regulator with GAF, ATPase, and Fis domain